MEGTAPGISRASRPSSAGVPLVWFVVAIIVAVAASGGGVYLYTQYATHLTVVGINWEVYVNNTLVGYVFNNPESGCTGGCPRNAQVNSVWDYLLVLPYGPALYNLSVVGLTLPLPFYIVGISPAIPRVLTAGGGSVSFRVAIQLPPDPGTYSTLGAVWTD